MDKTIIIDSPTKDSQIPIMVSIKCLVYNHEPFLRDCLNGFIMQKTNFRFEAIIHDDASTDGSAAIIREYAEKYPDIIKPIFETENQHSKKDSSIAKIMNPYLRGKYIAWCEGDDFWTDPYKLQKQVDAMEANPKASFTHTGFHVVNMVGNKINIEEFNDYNKRGHSGYVLFDLLVNMNRIMTVTFMVRNEIQQKFPFAFDYIYFMDASRKGECIYLEDDTSAYRINPNSIMQTKPQSLEKPRFLHTYKLLEKLISNDKETAIELKEHKLYKTVIGYMLMRNIYNNPINRYDYFKLLVKHPKYYYYSLKGFFIKLFNEKNFRSKVISIY